MYILARTNVIPSSDTLMFCAPFEYSIKINFFLNYKMRIMVYYSRKIHNISEQNNQVFNFVLTEVFMFAVGYGLLVII